MAWHLRSKLRRQIMSGNPPRWLLIHPRRSYLERIALATPEWVTNKDFAQLRKQRDERSKQTGTEHVLDHIVPLNHTMVCGLNVPWNIEIMTRKRNATKSNRWCPDQLELDI